MTTPAPVVPGPRTVDGTFVYNAWNTGQPVRLRVRGCGNPSATRLFLEQLLDRPVRWERG